MTTAPRQTFSVETSEHPLPAWLRTAEPPFVRVVADPVETNVPGGVRITVGFPVAEIAGCVADPEGVARRIARALSSGDLYSFPEGLSLGLMDVIAERHRQPRVEGFTADHDDDHRDGVLAMAGAAYAYRVGQVLQPDATSPGLSAPPPACWPWSRRWWKPDSCRRMLVKAAALIVAEIDRLDREAEAVRKAT
jgi:hypothetical protein